ncbi:hypothetical protein ABZY05_45845 [Streptomyces canus]|uniref:hypothetical protein n=1 Tax=Streptomyces canus TaxID=58343 RepID=UPI0033A20626
MKLFPVSRLRTTTTVAAASALLATGFIAAPGSGAASATSDAQSSVKAPYTSCYKDGDSFGHGTPVGSGPLRWKYTGTPYAGARYDRCQNKVTFYYGGDYKFPAWYEVKWSRTQVHTFKDQATKARKATVTAGHGGNPNNYTLQVRACSGTLCTRWSPMIILSYYP